MPDRQPSGTNQRAGESTRHGMLLVVIQMVLIGVLAAGPVGRWLTGQMPPIGTMLVIAAAMLLGGWAMLAMRLDNFSVMPTPRAGGELVTRGPYRWIRHPMYTSVLLAGIGLVFDEPSLLPWIAWLLLVVDLVIKMRLEEHLLASRHAGYASYRQATYRLIPGLY